MAQSSIRRINSFFRSQHNAGIRFIAGIDHNFSFPKTYLNRNGIDSWDDFLKDFCEHWPTHMPGVTVEHFRENNARGGSPDEFRLTEKWTSSAKSVFRFDVQGQVAKSAHSGIPWLHHIRQQVGDGIHFWPFDGFEIDEGKSVIAEVYPSIFRNRYNREERSSDEHDAYSISKWLSDRDRKHKLQKYFETHLPKSEKKVAQREGWILGIC